MKKCVKRVEKDVKEMRSNLIGEDVVDRRTEMKKKVESL